MKKVLLICFITSSFYGFSQAATHGNLTKKGSFSHYKTKSNLILKIGDTLTIGMPGSDLGFNYISQGNQRVSRTLANTNIIIDKLKTYGNKTAGYKMYIHFKGYGLLPVLIDYETALETKEIKSIK